MLDKEQKSARNKANAVLRRAREEMQDMPDLGDLVIVKLPFIETPLQGILRDVNWTVPYTESLVDVEIPGGFLSTYYKYLEKEQKRSG